MSLIVRIISDPDTCTPLGNGRFTLRPANGRFRLPQLELAPALPHQPPHRLHTLRISAVLAGTPKLAAAIGQAWTAAELEHQVISEPMSSAMAYLDASTVDGSQTVGVTWLASYTPANDTTLLAPDELEVNVELQLQPEQAQPRSPRAQPHPGFVAIDFGTSNSTVTLFDQDKLYTRALAVRQAARLRDRVIDLIASPTVPQESRGELQEVLGRVARATLSDGLPTGIESSELQQRLVAKLCEEPLGEPKLLYAVLLGLELERSTRTEPLCSWLSTQLHTCYDEAFQVPGLDALQLFPVELDPASGGHELPSRVEVTQLQPFTVRLGAELVEGAAASRAEVAQRGHLALKQYLGKPEQRSVADSTGQSAKVDTDQLIKGALAFLLDRSNSFVKNNPKALGQGQIDHAVITYPTVAPPVVRHHLRELLSADDGAAIGLVETRYDEAVAAAMFFLMRDFGGDFGVGVEAAKARYRPIAKDAWAQNILVIDIGGGTTDIALLTMTLQDKTPPVPGADPKWLGRYYTVTPKVRGSTGHLQLGGEYLTLQVFLWLKAALADLLLAKVPDQFSRQIQALPERYKQGSEYSSGSLVEAVLHRDRDDNPVLDVVEDVLPTRWADKPTNGQAFWLMWRLAERAKLALGDPLAAEPMFELTSLDVRQILNAVGAATGNTAQLPDLRLELGATPFERLVSQPLREIMQLATELVLDRFTVNSSEELDRIILTGKTSALAQVRHTLNTHFGHREGSDRQVRWKNTDVRIERDFSKLATSIGACWAESIRQFAFDPPGAIPRLVDGQTVLYIDVENLFFNLPCTFARRQQEGYTSLISVGAELFQLDTEMTGKVRSRWEQLTEIFTVYRMIKPQQGVSWGNFKFQQHAMSLQDGFVPAPPVWPEKIKVQLEATQDLDLWLHLCRGSPHYVVGGPTLNVFDALKDLARETDTAELLPWVLSDDQQMPTALPGDIVVNSLIAGSGERGGDVVFAASTPDAQELGNSPFDEEFFDSDDPREEPTKGTISRHLPPPPDATRGAGGQPGWTFHLRLPDGSSKLIGELPKPTLGEGDFPKYYRATIDARGRLHVHAGELPYRKAGSLREVELEPGRVYTLQVQPGDPDHDKARDPFSGKH